MNKEETTIVVLLFLLLVAWGFFMVPRGPVGLPEQPAAVSPEDAAQTNAISGQAPGGQDDVVTAPVLNALQGSGAEEAEEGATMIAGHGHRDEEQVVTLSNEHADVLISSWGGAVKAVVLKDYRAVVTSEIEKVQLDFSTGPALALRGVPGLTTNDDFTVRLDDSGRSVDIERVTAQGISLKRVISIGDDYSLNIRDVYSNVTDGVLTLPAGGIDLGPMFNTVTSAKTRGMTYLDADTLADTGGAPVRQWGKDFSRLFGVSGGLLAGCARQDPTVLPPAVSGRAGSPVLWGAVKNKFFVQILSRAGERAAADCEVRAVRDTQSRAFELVAVSASLLCDGETLAPGGSVMREFEYYAGPKKYDILSRLDRHRDKVMLRAWKGWGWFRDVCVLLLKTLNAIYAVLPNYGVAIILLTVIVRVLFWPITHMGTENMKKMQKIQPLVTELRNKYKSDPQKMQQETMLLYRKNKVNPMMGCLPMLVQVPIFIALFTVLRSAVELRFAPFLWIPDLSEPERLLEFGFAIPLINWDCLNILPMIMTATMVWQQKLTPSSGDPQQQKMMAVVMPIMMLVLLYNMASALMLYWSVSQSLAILQLVLQQRRTARQEAASAPPGS